MTPAGGLSFIVNASIVIIGSIVNFFVRRSARIERMVSSSKSILNSYVKKSGTAFISYAIVVSIFVIISTFTVVVVEFELHSNVFVQSIYAKI